MNDNYYMNLALELAQRGACTVSPNPMVGAVVVINDQVVGSGWHRCAGESHAEVLAVNDALSRVGADDLHRATLYVNLEPCSHWGRTPPCADMIIEHGIPRVVVGCIDPFEKVSGGGITKMRDAGVDVLVGVMEQESIELNRRFFTVQTTARPYVILKWAHTIDGYLDANRPVTTPPAWMTGNKARELVHRWRAEEDAIMVGSHTARMDNPSLTVRHYLREDGTPPSNPIRVIPDIGLQLSPDLHIFDSQASTILITSTSNLSRARARYEHHPRVEIESVPFSTTPTDKRGRTAMLSAMLDGLYSRGVQSLFVEGGAALLESFIDSGLWDEARVFVSPMLAAELYPGLPFTGGVVAPKLDHAVRLSEDEQMGLTIFRPIR